MRSVYSGAQGWRALDHLLPEQTNDFVCPDCRRCSHVQVGAQNTAHEAQRADASDGPPRRDLSASLTGLSDSRLLYFR